MSVRATASGDQEIRELIAVIDRFHRNQLKDRDDSHIQQEVSVIKEFLAKWGTEDRVLTVSQPTTQEKKMENKYQEIKDAVKSFEACQKEYLKFGAWDTEPDSVFQWAITDAWVKGENTIKHDPNYWQLFTSTMNCNKAGKELGKSWEIVGKEPTRPGPFARFLAILLIACKGSCGLSCSVPCRLTLSQLFPRGP